MNTIQASRIRGQPRGIVDTLFDIQDEEMDAGKGVIFTDDAIKSQLLETIGAGRIGNNIMCTKTGSWCLVHVWRCKISPHTSSLCSYIFSCPQGSWIVCCLHLIIEFCSCAKGVVSGEASFITTDEQLQ